MEKLYLSFKSISSRGTNKDKKRNSGRIQIFLFRQFAALHIFTSPALYQQVVLLNMIKKIGIFKISCYVNHRKIIDKVHDCSWHTTSHPLFFWLFSSTFPGFNFFVLFFGISSAVNTNESCSILERMVLVSWDYFVTK